MAARQTLERLRIDRVEDLHELDDVAWALGALVVDGKIDGAEGRHVRRGGRSLITVREGLYLPRRRFTVAHELGHLAMHGEFSDLTICLQADVTDSPRDSQRARGRNLEAEANDFASCFLMPANLFGPLVRSAAPSFDLFDDLTETFQVSLSAALARFVKMTSEQCALVHSENGITKFAIRSRDFEEAGLFVASGPVDPYSYAHAAFNGGEVPRKGERVDASCWLSPGRWQDDGMLREFTWPMPKYSKALTLLWVDEALDVD